jgi:hypothetical protein
VTGYVIKSYFGLIAVPVLSYGSEMGATEKNETNVQSAGLEFLRPVKGN